MTSGSSDLADDIVPSAIPKHIKAFGVEFKPWHKVRKQFIRERQWNELIGRTVKRYLRAQLQTRETARSADVTGKVPSTETASVPESVRIDRPLRCLMIPGDDLLDLRSLWQHLRPYDCYIRYLGFNEHEGSNQTGSRVHVANNEVTSLDGMVTDSLVLPDRFQSIASENSTAYRYLKEYGPFHVVNLDLCDSLFPTTSQDSTDYFNAIHRLTDYQAKHHSESWLLFITTQVEPNTVSIAEMQALCQPARENYNAYPEFAAEMNKLAPEAAFRSSEATVNLSEVSEEQMIRVFGVALGKWLISLASSGQPQWIVQMHRSHRYSLKCEKNVAMLSLAFQFRPKHLPPIDSTGLSKLKQSIPSYPSELDCAIRLVTAVCKIDDIDDRLRNDPETFERMRLGSADLMESAGYDRAKYLEWVLAGETT